MWSLFLLSSPTRSARRSKMLLRGIKPAETASEGEGATRPQLLSGHRKHKTGCSPRTKVSTINYLPFNNLRGVTS